MEISDDSQERAMLNQQDLYEDIDEMVTSTHWIGLGGAKTGKKWEEDLDIMGDKFGNSGSSGNSVRSADSESSRARYRKEKRLGQQEHCQKEGCIKEASSESDESASSDKLSEHVQSKALKNGKVKVTKISPVVLFSPESRLDQLIEDKSFE